VIGKIGSIVLLMAGCWSASAGTAYIVVAPPVVGGQQLTGMPGDPVGWGFTIFGDTANWIQFQTSTLIESSYLGPSGTSTGYVDFLGVLGGKDNTTWGPLLNPGDTWTLAFNASNGSGIGEYLIDPGTPIPAYDAGAFSITYNMYTCDPNICTPDSSGPNPTEFDGLTLYASPTSSTLPTFAISVQTPEPSTVLPFGLLAVGWAAFALRRRFAK
jgi:hypothetical protein